MLTSFKWLTLFLFSLWEFSVLYGGLNDIILHKKDEWRHDVTHAIVTCYLALRNETKGQRVVQCTKSNSNLSFGHHECLWTALGQGLGCLVDMALACGSGHMNLAVQALTLGQSINLHSAVSLSYYCLTKISSSQNSFSHNYTNVVDTWCLNKTKCYLLLNPLSMSTLVRRTLYLLRLILSSTELFSACSDIIGLKETNTQTYMCNSRTYDMIHITRKCVFEHFRPGMTQTGLFSYSD